MQHIHALISYPKEIHEKVLQAYKDIFNAPQNLKSTYLSKEQVKNGEINGFQWSINNPAGYVLKYINKSFVNCLENKELNHQQAWYIKYKVRRFTTSRHQIPLWIYRKINFFKKDFYNLCLLKDHSDWFCEWDYSSQYFRLSNIKTTELINYENGVLEYSIQGKIIHRYEKKFPKKPQRQKIDFRTYDEKDKKPFGRWEGRKPINRMKDYEFLEYFKALAISNSPHYALCLNELKKRGLNKIFGFDYEISGGNNGNKKVLELVEYDFKFTTILTKEPLKFSSVTFFFGIENRNKKFTVFPNDLTKDTPVNLQYKIIIQNKEKYLILRSVQFTLQNSPNVIYEIKINTVNEKVILFNHPPQNVLEFKTPSMIKVGVNEYYNLECEIVKDQAFDVNVGQLIITFQSNLMKRNILSTSSQN